MAAICREGDMFKGASGGLETASAVAVYLGEGLNVKLPERGNFAGCLERPCLGRKFRDLSFQEHDQKYKRHLSWQ